MIDYSDLGLDSKLRKGPAARLDDYQTDFEQDAKVEKGPYSKPTEIQKGTSTTTLGGIWTIKDSTGGTTLMTVNPDTGVITLAGDLTVTSTLDGGTIGTATIIGGTAISLDLHNATMGTSSITAGTATNLNTHNAIIGTSSYDGGTVNPAQYEINGTSGLAATATIVGGGTTHVLTFEKGILVGYGTS